VQPESRRSTVAFAAGAMVVSFTAPIVRLLATGPSVTAFWRMVFGGAILVGLVFAQRRRIALDRRSLLFAALAGLAFACDLSLWHRSIRLVGPGLATILVSLQVFFMSAVGLVTRRERLTWRLALAVPLALLGLLLIVGVDWRAGAAGYRWGVLFGAASALCYTGYLLALRRLQRDADLPARMTNMAAVSILCAAFLAAIALAAGESFAIPGAGSLGLLVLLGVVGQVLAWVLLSGGLPRMRHSLAGLLLLLQPLLASAWDVLFFRHSATLLEASGAVVTLAAIYLGTTASD
jgi:drug/metabolite transporter (DMT)-like permease